ncbi:MAG: UDP-N-acetylmuramoyl-tripeptide--D-alanyl-D-alanine ligase [Candidatus Hydrogenedentes bacterium]|nr:UDP-N-acetylmuramoyl-tripeptide--D-alanyl-D-alanine ligase [Candidatus Hydrogenedentota bacterium]
MPWQYSLQQLAAVLGAEPPVPDAVFESVSTDTRKLTAGQLFFALSGERFDGAAFVDTALDQGAIAAVTTRSSHKGPCIVVDDPLAALQRFAAWHRDRLNPAIFAVTGSAGKTTVKDMTAAVLASRYRTVKTQGNLNNEIGVPLSLLSIDEATECAVIEMGANHMGEIAMLCRMARPQESAVTRVAPAHLEGFGSIDNVEKAKGEIAEGLPADGTFYVNTDDPRCVRIADRFSGRKIHYGSRGDVVLKECLRLDNGNLMLYVEPGGTLELPLPVRAYASNVLLAVAVGLQHGITDFQTPLALACENLTRFRIYQLAGLDVLDDCYNANPVSMAAALQALSDRPGTGARIAVLGEMLEMGEEAARVHRELGEMAGRLGVTHLFARGPHACDTIAGAASAQVPVAEACESHDEIASAVYSHARPGDLLLVKGSRGMAMEKVIEALRDRYSREGK